MLCDLLDRFDWMLYVIECLCAHGCWTGVGLRRDLLCAVGQRTQGGPVILKAQRAVRIGCRPQEGGPDVPRLGEWTSHTVDSESGPGGLKARCGRTNHTADSMYMARHGGWTEGRYGGPVTQ